MIVYGLQSAYKNGNYKYAPLYPDYPEGEDAYPPLDLDRWRFLGPHFHGPFTRENWTKPYGDVWPKEGFRVKYAGKKKRVDCTCINTLFFAFSHRAIELLGDDLDKDKGEFLPVLCGERDDLLIYRCMNCLDALDRERSEQNGDAPGWDVIDEFGILGKVTVSRYVFKEEVIQETPMFLLPCHLSIDTFVTDRFLARFQEKKLKGLGFRPMWSSERGPLCDQYGQMLYEDVEDVNC